MSGGGIEFAVAAEETGPDAPEPEGHARPEHIPEKFWDAEKGEVRVDDLAKSYAELEKGKSTPTEAAPEQAPAEDPESAAAEETVREAGLDFSALEAEYTEKGGLSEETYEKLAKAGISKELADNYISGQEAKSAAFQASVFERVGGQETFNEINKWASQNLSEAEASAYNKAIDAGDQAAYFLALDGVRAKYEAANGRSPSLVGGQSSPSPATAGYRSMDEVVRAMGDPRYSTDEAYRADVARKLAASDVV